MRTAKSFLGAAGVSLALAFTFFACTSDGVIGGEGGTSSSILPSSSSSSSVEETQSSSSEIETSSSSSVDACENLNQETEFCFEGAVYEKCGWAEYDPTTQFCDERDDGQIYNFTQIGTQIWMAENLKFDAEGSLCYEGRPERCDAYGRLYDWTTAMDIPQNYDRNIYGTFCGSYCFNPSAPTHQGICPSGWHIPTDAEWTTLINYVELQSSVQAGFSLKALDVWFNSNNGTDEFGFTALPGGYYDTFNYREVGDSGNWWSATESTPNLAHVRYIDYNPTVITVDGEKRNFSAFAA